MSVNLCKVAIDLKLAKILANKLKLHVFNTRENSWDLSNALNRWFNFHEQKTRRPLLQHAVEKTALINGMSGLMPLPEWDYEREEMIEAKGQRLTPQNMFFDPLEEEGCRVRYVSSPRELGNPHLIILPGTKSTISDLHYLRRSGLADEILRQVKSGTPIVGICGGYQMLGRSILDPQGVETAKEEALGLGLLDVVTNFAAEKSTSQVRTRVLADRGLFAGMKGQELVGYEIHMGQTSVDESKSAFLIFEKPQGTVEYYDGILNAQGTVLGTYLHGLFHNFGFRQVLLTNLRQHWGLPERKTGALAGTEQQYDRLATLVRHSLNMAAIYTITEKGINE